MNSRHNLHFLIALLVGLALALTGALLAQGNSDQTTKTVVVNGKTMDTAVLQLDGRYYMDLQTLAQITNGAVTVEPNRVVLTIPSSNSGAPSGDASPNTPELSKDFMRAAISELAEMREWRGAIGMMITYGLAVSGSWSQDYYNRAQEGLQQATVAASTEADQSALLLLRNEFDKLATWASDAIAARQQLNGEKTVDPNALANDQTLKKITDCSQFLNGMLVSGVFSDYASCH